jgi:hypothetical protein
MAYYTVLSEKAPQDLCTLMNDTITHFDDGLDISDTKRSMMKWLQAYAPTQVSTAKDIDTNGVGIGPYSKMGFCGEYAAMKIGMLPNKSRDVFYGSEVDEKTDFAFTFHVGTGEVMQLFSSKKGKRMEQSAWTSCAPSEMDYEIVKVMHDPQPFCD